MLKDEIDLNFNYEPVPFGDIRDGKGAEISEKAKILLESVVRGEGDFSGAYERLNGKRGWFTKKLIYAETVCPTITASHRDMFDYDNVRKISKSDVIHAQTFPEDYAFDKDTYSHIEYICGMSVPPVMIKRVITRLIEQGVYSYAAK